MVAYLVNRSIEVLQYCYLYSCCLLYVVHKLGAAVVGDKIYFAPLDAGVVGVVDTAANEGAGAFSVLSLEDKVSGSYLFAGAVAVGNKVYFAPSNADCIGIVV